MFEQIQEFHLRNEARLPPAIPITHFLWHTTIKLCLNTLQKMGLDTQKMGLNTPTTNRGVETQNKLLNMYRVFKADRSTSGLKKMFFLFSTPRQHAS